MGNTLLPGALATPPIFSHPSLFHTLNLQVKDVFLGQTCVALNETEHDGCRICRTTVVPVLTCANGLFQPALPFDAEEFGCAPNPVELSPCTDSSTGQRRPSPVPLPGLHSRDGSDEPEEENRGYPIEGPPLNSAVRRPSSPTEDGLTSTPLQKEPGPDPELLDATDECADGKRDSGELGWGRRLVEGAQHLPRPPDVREVLPQDSLVRLQQGDIGIQLVGRQAFKPRKNGRLFLCIHARQCSGTELPPQSRDRLISAEAARACPFNSRCRPAHRRLGYS